MEARGEAVLPAERLADAERRSLPDACGEGVSVGVAALLLVALAEEATDAEAAPEVVTASDAEAHGVESMELVPA